MNSRTQHAESPRQRRKWSQSWLAALGNWWHEVVLTLLLLGLLVAIGASKPTLITPRSQLFLASHLWEMAILGLAMTMIIVTGGIDLSVGSAMGLCAVTFGMTFEATGNHWFAALAAMAVGLAGGMTNGWLVARIKLHPLIVTLATYAAFRGLAEGISQGKPYSGFGDGFSQLARGTLWYVPLPAVLLLVLTLLTTVFLTATPNGRFLYVIGSNEQAARFCGIPVDRIKWMLYCFSGLTAGLTAVLDVSRFDTAKADAGSGIELDVITAVVVGGTSIYGGRGRLSGTLLGLLLIHETRLFVGGWRIEELKSIVVGCLLIAAILLYRLIRQRH